MRGKIEWYFLIASCHLLWFYKPFNKRQPKIAQASWHSAPERPSKTFERNLLTKKDHSTTIHVPRLWIAIHDCDLLHQMFPKQSSCRNTTACCYCIVNCSFRSQKTVISLSPLSRINSFRIFDVSRAYLWHHDTPWCMKWTGGSTRTCFTQHLKY